MTGMPYEDSCNEGAIRDMMSMLGGNNVVLTGVSFEEGKTGVAVRENGNISCYFHKKFDRSFHGTGDIFAAAFTGAWLQNKTLSAAAQIAADFTCASIWNTIQNPAHWYGVKFETALGTLMDALK